MGTTEGFFKHMGKMRDDASAESVGASSSVDLDQEAVPADDGFADRPDVVVRVHRVPRRRLYVPNPDDDPPPVPILSFDVTRCTITDLENSGEAPVNDVWPGDASDTRELSEFGLERR